jgi:hypothetical protein
LHALIIVRFLYIVKRRLKFFYAAQKTCFFVCAQRRDPGNGALYQCKNGRIPSFLVQPLGAGYLYRRMTTTVADLVFRGAGYSTLAGARGARQKVSTSI